MPHLRIISLLAFAPMALAAQTGKAEQDVRAFLTTYDRAQSERDTAFLGRVLPDDYVMTGASGRKSDRTQVLRFFAREHDKPSFRVVSIKHENVMVRVVGAMALVTNEYTALTTPIETPNAEPDVAQGRHTKVLENRNGRWMVIAEQDTEQPRDDKRMERQVAQAGRNYYALVQRLRSGRSAVELEANGDLGAINRIFEDGYMGTNEDGVVSSKAGALARHTANSFMLTSAELTAQKVRAVDNNTAVETGIVRYRGTDAGKSRESTVRYTTTWVSWGRGWQIVAYHASAAKE